MTTPQNMRDLARRLLVYEAAAGQISTPMVSPTLLVYEKLRHSLGEFMGVAGFQSLAARALVLARSESAVLEFVTVADDGTLHGLAGIVAQTDQSHDLAGEEEISLLAHLLGLLRLFLGEALTFSLVRNAWPGKAFEDCN